MAKYRGPHDSDDDCDDQPDQVCDPDRDGVLDEDPYRDWDDLPDVMVVIFDVGDFFADIDNDD